MERCPHCDPYDADPRHVEVFLSSLLNPLGNIIDRFPGFNRWFNAWFFRGVFKALLSFGVLREFDVDEEDPCVLNRALVVIREARRRGIPIRKLRFFGFDTNFFSYTADGTVRHFEGLPSTPIGSILPVDFDDKDAFKVLLRKNGMPFPEGKAFRDASRAVRYVESELGFPVVVKPCDGSLSKHVTCGIKSTNALIDAIRIAKIIDPEFVVERHIEGGVHRVTVVGETVACCLREPPSVTGDGVHTVEELIGIKNAHPLRGEQRQKNATLHKITVTPKTLTLLAERGFDLKTVLPVGQKAILHDKLILACGADIHDRTDSLHPINRRMFLDVASLCGASLVGFDFMCTDVSVPWTDQPCAIIEANSVPYIDMHHYPTTGAPRDIAAALLDRCLAHG